MFSEPLILVSSSAAFAAEAHKAQVRKELDEPYILHPLRVAKMAAELGMDAEFIAACHLHDVIEDTSVPAETVQRIFPVRTFTLVDVVSKWWQEHPTAAAAANKALYYERILQTKDAPLLKLIDRIDNLYDFARMARLAAPKAHTWAARYHEKTVREFEAIMQALQATPSFAHDKALGWYRTALSALEDAL